MLLFESTVSIGYRNKLLSHYSVNTIKTIVFPKYQLTIDFPICNTANVSNKNAFLYHCNFMGYPILLAPFESVLK